MKLMVVDKKDAERLAQKIIRETAPILDRRQRSYALSKKLKKIQDEMVAEIFHIIAIGARDKKPIYQDGYRVISDIGLLAHYLGARKMSGIYSYARHQNYQEVVRIMSRTPPWKTPGTEDQPMEDQELKERTLGERKSLARTRDRDLITRLLHDQDPTVIYILLQNPILTIKEVVAIASKRPTNAQILWQIYKNMKWINYYSVKKSLINNPYCPTQIALSLLHFMLEQDLEDIAENQVLHPKIQHSALEILVQRRKKKKRAEDTDF